MGQIEMGFAYFSLGHWVCGTENHKIGRLGLQYAEKWDLGKMWAGKRDFSLPLQDPVLA